jgi:hypothetical protein
LQIQQYEFRTQSIAAMQTKERVVQPAPAHQ